MISKKKLKKHSKKCKAFLKNSSKNYWAISTTVLAVLLIITMIPCNVTGNAIGAKEVGEKVLNFASSRGTDVGLVSVNDNGQLYEVILSIQGQEVPVFVTKDGENLIPDLQCLIPLTGQVTRNVPQQQERPTPTEVPKSDKPVAELFIMTHCPYGTQAEKGFVPLLESFDKADAKIRFIHYFMHEDYCDLNGNGKLDSQQEQSIKIKEECISKSGRFMGQEPTETPIQICIREEQPDKFLPYLREFLKEGISADAIQVASIDETKMNECISSGKWEEYYNIDKALSESYDKIIKEQSNNKRGMGSPTLVVNGVVTQSGRDSASYLSTICSAFNNAPEECGTLTLSSTAPSPMWGWDTSGTNTQAQC